VESYVVFGKPGFSSLNLSEDGSNGFVLEDPNETNVSSVSNAGDVTVKMASRTLIKTTNGFDYKGFIPLPELCSVRQKRGLLVLSSASLTSMAAMVD